MRKWNDLCILLSGNPLLQSNIVLCNVYSSAIYMHNLYLHMCTGGSYFEKERNDNMTGGGSGEQKISSLATASVAGGVSIAYIMYT